MLRPKPGQHGIGDIDDDGDEGTGVIQIRGPSLFPGYWRMPEKTASEFRPDGFFITGDLGKIDEAGKVRTRSKALAWLLAALDEAKDPELLMVFHGLADDAPEFTAKVQERFPDVELITGILGPVVGTHTGPRAIGVGWVERA